jgi:hypothetical protein
MNTDSDHVSESLRSGQHPRRLQFRLDSRRALGHRVRSLGRRWGSNPSRALPRCRPRRIGEHRNPWVRCCARPQLPHWTTRSRRGRHRTRGSDGRRATVQHRSAFHPRHLGCAGFIRIGAFGVPLWQTAVGAFIGSAPRAFVYTALGASIGDLSSPLAYSAVAVWCVTAIIGAFAAHRGYRHWRGRGREGDGSAGADRLAPYRRALWTRLHRQ